MNSGHAVVLMSGGIDSAATVAACSGEYATLSGLFIDYGQPARKSEWEAAQGIAGYFGINIAKSDIGLRMTPRHGEYFGRNALMLLAAASSHAVRPLTVALGIHSMCVRTTIPLRCSQGICSEFWTDTLEARLH